VNIGYLLQLLSQVPREKLKTDSGLKEVLRTVAKKSGKQLSEADLDRYVSQFRSMVRTETPSSLMQKLNRKGVRSSELDKLRNKFKK
jgi:glycine cleavage system pyridoxal-binding protein P